MSWVPRGFRAVLTTAIVLPRFLSAQGDRWDQQVTHALEHSVRSLGDRGYRQYGPARSGLLFVDETARIEVPVSGKAEYLVLGVCDDDCTGLQLVIANGTGYEIDAARGPGNSPMVRVVPPILPGTYRITVKMSGCGMSPCHYGVGVFRRPEVR